MIPHVILVWRGTQSDLPTGQAELDLAIRSVDVELLTDLFAMCAVRSVHRLVAVQARLAQRKASNDKGVQFIDSSGRNNTRADYNGKRRMHRKAWTERRVYDRRRFRTPRNGEPFVFVLFEPGTRTLMFSLLETPEAGLELGEEWAFKARGMDCFLGRPMSSFATFFGVFRREGRASGQ